MIEHSDDDDDIAGEERHIYAIIVGASLPVLLGLLLEGGTMDGGTTLSLAVLIFGAAGLIAGVVAAMRSLRVPRLPRATLRGR